MKACHQEKYVERLTFCHLSECCVRECIFEKIIYNIQISGAAFTEEKMGSSTMKSA